MKIFQKKVPKESFYPKDLLKDCKYCIGKIDGEEFHIFKPPRAHHCK